MLYGVFRRCGVGGSFSDAGIAVFPASARRRAITARGTIR